MPRVTNGPATRARRNRTFQKAKGYFGNKSRLYTAAREAVERAQKFAYRDRRANKRNFRSLWIVRLNAACRPLEITYSRLMDGLKKAGVVMDRKNLSELAIHDAPAFEAIVAKAKEALAAAPVAAPAAPKAKPAKAAKAAADKK